MAKATSTSSKKKSSNPNKKPVEAPKPKVPAKKIKQRNQVLKGKNGGTKLVLIEDVAHLGRPGDVVEVKAGYARNFLVPNSLAVSPTAHNIRLLERFQIRVKLAKEARIADIKVLSDQITRTASVTIEANSNEEGQLYGSVGPIEVSRALKGKNITVEPEMVHMAEHIKFCGQFPDIELHLGYEIVARIMVNVIPLAAPRR